KGGMSAGLNSAGVDVSDLRVLPAALGRHLLKTESYDAGFHVGVSNLDPDLVQIRLFEYPGIQLGSSLQKEIEKHFLRQDLRRAGAGDVGTIDYPARVRESYAQDLLANVDAEAIRGRRYRIVVDYSHSAASLVLPLVLDPLGVEMVTRHGFTTSEPSGVAALQEAIGQTKRLVQAVGADLGAVLDRAAERLYLIDEQGREISVEQALLLYLRLLGSNGRRGKLA